VLRHLASGVWMAFTTWLLLQVVIGAYVTYWPGAAVDVVSLGLLHALVLGSATFVLGSSLLPKGEGAASEPRLLAWQRALGLSNPRSHALGLGVLVGLVAKVPADALRSAVELRFPTNELELVQQWSLLAHDTWWQAASLFIVIGFTGPLLEEVFYRGALVARLGRGLGEVSVWLSTSVVFAVSHPSPRDWPSLLLVGLVLGDLRRVGGSVWPSLGAHIAFNCATLLAVVLGAQTQTSEVVIDWWLVSGASGLLGGLLILVRRLL
jgi:membrane protease YdiL (CAAX protease family)